MSRRRTGSASALFYSRLFDAEPTMRRPRYADFDLAEPPLKLVLLEGQPGHDTRLDHLGVEVAGTVQVDEANRRLADARAPPALRTSTPTRGSPRPSSPVDTEPPCCPA